MLRIFKNSLPTFRTYSTNNVSSLRPLTVEQALQQKLEWRERVLEDGSVMYYHPRAEQVLSVKLAKMYVNRVYYEKKRDLENKVQAQKLEKTKPNLKISKETLEEQRRQLIEQVKADVFTKTMVLSPEQIQEARILRQTDPYTYTSQYLAKLFHVSPEQIVLVTKEPEEKVKQDLRELHERNKNRPRHGSKKYEL